MTYTATVRGGPGGVTDIAGNPLAANVSSSFSTPAACPCTLYGPTDAPLGGAAQDQPLEVGVKLQADEDGWLSSLRFYKQANNTGTHVGHVWSASGELLAEVEFTGETASGWQQQELPSPIPIARDTTFVVSYHSSAGFFAFSPGAMALGVHRAPLHAPADSAVGGNGVYRYGASGFPNTSWNATSYWVDATFERTRPPDTRAPKVASTSPAAQATGVALSSKVKVVFDEPLNPSTVNAGAITLKDGSGAAVVATVTYNEQTRTATLSPLSPLVLGKEYTARVLTGSAGVTDLSGNRLAADKVWSFRTPAACPCTVFKSDRRTSGLGRDDQPVEVGMKIRSDEDGYITGAAVLQAGEQHRHARGPPLVRHRHAARRGHVHERDRLRVADGRPAEPRARGQEHHLHRLVPLEQRQVRLRSGVLHERRGQRPDEGACERRRRRQRGLPLRPERLPGAPPSTPRTTGSTRASTGPCRRIPAGPRSPSTSPPAGSIDLDRGTQVSASFDEPLRATSVSAATFTLRDAGGAAVPADVTYDDQTHTARLVPQAPLAWGTTYTATVKSGASGITDAAGNPLSTDRTWSFTTATQSPAEGPGGPILLMGAGTDRFASYYAEILRGEGLNEFSTADGPVTAQALAGKTVVILGAVSVTDAEVTVLQNWVAGGGNLIAMRPDKKLAGLLGLSDAGGTLANGYMKVDQGSASGAGIDPQTLQFHGTADRYTLSGAQEIAGLYSDAVTETANPAVTLRDVGSGGGQAASFAYDLARSVVYTRQGNPAWAGQKRDGTPNGIRSVDLFYGAKAGDIQPDWVDPARIDVPQADEQQRLLANLITEMNRDSAPLPRLWYLPRGEKAAVILTGDDHSIGLDQRVLRPAQGHRRRAAPWRIGSVPARRHTFTPTRPCRTFRRLATRPTGSSWPCTSRPAARTTRRSRSRTTSPLSSGRSAHPGRASSPRSRTAPTASSGVTGPLRRRPSAATAFASTPTTTTTGRRPGSASRV